MVSFNGYIFRFHKLGFEKRIWLCDRQREDKCKARLHTTIPLPNPQLLTEMGTHNHRPDAIACEVRSTMTSVRHAAINSNETPTTIIDTNIQQMSATAQGALPVLGNIKRGIRAIRSAGGGSLVIPHRREDINLPPSFQKTASGDDFLFFDSGADSSRILIFTTQNLEFLKSADTWLADGTFKVAPTLFDQLFVIHAFRNGATFPLVFCLTPNRTTQTYCRVLSALKTAIPELDPKTIMTDYELASINSFRQVFPSAENKGCFFHFAQCVFRHIQQFPDILALFTNEADFSLQLWHLVALAFVPPEDVISNFDLLMEEPFFVEHEALLTSFVQYFERTWIGPLNRRGTARIAPLYEISVWNCYHSVLNDLPKTNNACEGFHHGFSALLGSHHPTIYKLIDGFKEQQTLTELTIHQFRAGNPPQQRKKYKLAAEKLKRVVEDYGSPSLSNMDYLRQICYRIRKD
jgi:hypothetical protein